MTKQMTVWARIGVAVLLVAGLAVSSASHAIELNISPVVKKSVGCFVFARAQRLPASTLATYIKRIGKHTGDAGAVYWLGYSEGAIDAYGFSNSGKFNGSMKVARIDAATNLYKMMGCTINESI